MLYVYFFLWIAPHACLGIAVVLALSRRIHRRLPFFFWLMVYEVLSFLVGFACYLSIVHSHKYDPLASMVYHRVHMVEDGLEAVLKFAALYELAALALFSRFSLSDSFRRMLRWTEAGLLLTAVVLAATLARSGRLHLVNAIAILDFSVTFIQTGLLLSLLFCTKLLGLSWTRLSAGVALGFGLQSSVTIAASALFVRFGRPAYFSTDFVQMAAFQVCAIVWLVYLGLPSKESPTETRSMGVPEMEALGQEMQRLIGDFPGYRGTQ